MPTITTNVVSITPPKPPTEGKKQGPYRVKLGDGKEYSTFKAELVATLQPGMLIEADVSEKPDGEYTNYYLNGWDLVTAPEGSTPATAPSADWDAKDRTIAMESAYHSAAILFTGAWAGDTTETLKQFSLTARAIYRDVQRARAGHDFTPKAEVQE